ncbi:hypothetical protein A3A76_04655 [Candidatus Woesebacteria bacterium RIFCSPLOWO2_01_FULL_39_23]|uniref:Peptidase S9 prolyl oligopeptidase catalytic domain-containing protein n=1 Tax=Candidatus Woesebacteria bacterium RIFCSPHIGHO2_01_FULL_40_22 TaxID=1802499 RepID=A0A1F7YKU4_9BACT|nr:MAG: hypothetical protein A2141_02165 [Candidatus Woesebacteria bacterium RBG_16_40_11]OGM27135.1 MAG: hypothetical protein A2628_02415 [Candidatus Woesebacteria bacterium RIFCSPHIGHO2_01_FULL_40_22]OGM38360.1 MAG: hypothetical protein A3E41_00615 [Candidatus Woesebacteria bacterium RIFCSPHIGHO2_12_FULL_38_9]OGM63029.1 MAG: hypothetical protein A3A76_04655 [Candidatus Woesebacteria bacterium RIFCSPLOWO2_01_FULL_39_23]
MKNNSILLKVSGISGIYYPCGIKTNTIMIYGIGAPNVPDNGNLPEARVVLKKRIDLFVPDYIGFGRSEGRFTPKNCIKTFLILFSGFKLGVLGVSNYANFKKEMKYQNIIIAGRSLGGAYVPILPKFNNKINKIGIVFGALDQSEQGKIKGEETNDQFLKSILLDGYKYLYKGFRESLWIKHLNDSDGLSPMDNVSYLKNCSVFIAHGKKDECIHYSKSVSFYKALTQRYPGRRANYKLIIYKNGVHDSNTASKAIKAFLDWIEI